MNNIIALGLATLTIFINGLIGHFFAPNGILLTPVVLIITTSLVVFGTKNIKIIIVTILTYLFVALNDISIKLYSGGTHDSEGMGWIYLLLFIGLVPTLGLLITGIIRQKEEKLVNKLLAFGLFLALITVHLLIFSNLGIERSYWYDWNG